MDISELKFTARQLHDEITRRGIAVHALRLDRATALTFHVGGQLRMVIGVNPDISSASAIATANHKELTHYVLTEVCPGVRMPATKVCQTVNEAADFLERHKNIVAKPLAGAHGNGVVTDISSIAMLKAAFQEARRHSNDGRVLVQQQVSGEDVRVLVIDGKYITACRRVPAVVRGDGIRTVRELVVWENENNPTRGSVAYTLPLNKIDMRSVEQFLSSAMLERVPGFGEAVRVVGAANIGQGGSAEECTDELPASMLDDAVRVAKNIGAFIAGVDFMYDHGAQQWFLIEVNSSPSFGLHMMPHKGVPRLDLPKLYVDALFKRYNEAKNEK